MEKLELKHLAPYLPYGLEWFCLDKDSFEIETIDLENIDLTNEILEIGGMDIELSELPYPNGLTIKPILRPIEDLYNEKTDFGIKIVHYFNFKTNVKLDCRNFPYHVMEQLFKNNFDVFGLIDKDLAISYSDVQSSSNEG